MSKFAEYVEGIQRHDPLHGVIIRPAREADLDAVAEIAAEWEGEEVARWRRIFERTCTDGGAADRSILLVAALPALVVGYRRATRFTPPEDAPSNAVPEGWYLSGGVVGPDYRRRGVGAALTHERLAWLAQRAAEAYYFASALNRVTIALHDRFGFAEVTRDFWFPEVSFTGGVGILFRRDLEGAAQGGSGR